MAYVPVINESLRPSSSGKELWEDSDLSHSMGNKKRVYLSLKEKVLVITKLICLVLHSCP